MPTLFVKSFSTGWCKSFWFLMKVKRIGRNLRLLSWNGYPSVTISHMFSALQRINYPRENCVLPLHDRTWPITDYSTRTSSLVSVIVLASLNVNKVSWSSLLSCQWRYIDWEWKGVSIAVAVWSKEWVIGRSIAGIASSNPAGGRDICLLWVLCVVR